MKLFLTVFLFLATSVCFALPEKHYQTEFAKQFANAKLEIVAPDGTRCDILTDEYAIEVDFAKKWAEAVGQSLNYAFYFNKKAGIALIVDEKTYKYYIRLNLIIERYKLPITVWKIQEIKIPDETANRNK